MFHQRRAGPRTIPPWRSPRWKARRHAGTPPAPAMSSPRPDDPPGWEGCPPHARRSRRPPGIHGTTRQAGLGQPASTTGGRCGRRAGTPALRSRPTSPPPRSLPSRWRERYWRQKRNERLRPPSTAGGRSTAGGSGRSAHSAYNSLRVRAAMARSRRSANSGPLRRPSAKWRWRRETKRSRSASDARGPAPVGAPAAAGASGGSGGTAGVLSTAPVSRTETGHPPDPPGFAADAERAPQHAAPGQMPMRWARSSR